MATSTKKTKGQKRPKRRIVKGIEHGFSGHTNYGCRCDVCVEADRQHKREYRERKYGEIGENPTCIFPKCPRQQSRAYGHGLCYAHAQELSAIRKKNPRKAERILAKVKALHDRRKKDRARRAKRNGRER